MSANSEQRFGRYIGLVSWTLAALSIAAAAVKFYYSLCTASSTFADTPAMYLLFAGVFLLFYKLPSLIDRISSVKIGNYEILLRQKIDVMKDVVKSGGFVGGKISKDTPASDSVELPADSDKSDIVDTRDASTVEPIDPDDPQKGQWGGKSVSNDRLLDATVKTLPDDRDWFDMEIFVRSTNQQNPMPTEVTFHLHDSFSPSKVKVKVRNGVAQLHRFAWGAFTVGAEVHETDGTKTPLELDLALLPTAPKTFKTR